MTGDIVIREKDPNKTGAEDPADLELLVVGPDGRPVTLEIEESEEGVFKVGPCGNNNGLWATLLACRSYTKSSY